MRNFSHLSTSRATIRGKVGTWEEGVLFHPDIAVSLKQTTELSIPVLCIGLFVNTTWARSYNKREGSTHYYSSSDQTCAH